jgi:hypothetical protein
MAQEAGLMAGGKAFKDFNVRRVPCALSQFFN